MRAFFVVAMVLASGLLFASTVEAEGACTRVVQDQVGNLGEFVKRCPMELRQCVLSSTDPVACVLEQVRA